MVRKVKRKKKLSEEKKENDVGKISKKKLIANEKRGKEGGRFVKEEREKKGERDSKNSEGRNDWK